MNVNIIIYIYSRVFFNFAPTSQQRQKKLVCSKNTIKIQLDKNIEG